MVNSPSKYHFQEGKEGKEGKKGKDEKKKKKYLGNIKYKVFRNKIHIQTILFNSDN